MRSSELYTLLDRPDEYGGLRAAISPAMAEFRRGLAEPGRSAPVLVATEGCDLLVTEVHIAHLCGEFLAGHLDTTEVEYIASALDLCPDFRCASGSVKAAIFRLADPVANGPITHETVREVISSLPGRAA